MTPLAHIESAVPLFAGLLFASITDLRTRRVGNLLNASIALAGLSMWTVGFGWRGLVVAGGGLVACLAIGAWPFARGWLGAGDVKLLAAAGAWVGLAWVPMLIVLTAAAGGVVSLATLLLANRSARSAGGDPLTRPRSVQVPYALAIAVGTMLTAWMGGT